MADDCKTTFSLKISEFTRFSDKPIDFAQFTPGKEIDCEGHCLDSKNLSPCQSRDYPGTELRMLLQKVKQVMKE